jgi:hypothetical protein
MERDSKSHHQFLGCSTSSCQSFFGKFKATQAMMHKSTNHLMALVMLRVESWIGLFISIKKPRKTYALPRFVLGFISAVWA